MKWRQETTSLSQIATVTAKPRISDKERCSLANLLPVWMPRRSNFRQFSLRFSKRLLSVSFGGHILSARRVTLPFTQPRSIPGRPENEVVRHVVILCFISLNGMFEHRKASILGQHYDRRTHFTFGWRVAWVSGVSGEKCLKSPLP